MNIAKNKVVELTYTLTDPEGNILDATEVGNTFSYLHGHHQIIKGLENALEGKTAGHEFVVNVAPEEGYGAHDPNLLQEVPRDQFGEYDIEVGMQFRASTEQGEIPVRIHDLNDATVTVDANHPLAGIPLTFDVAVIAVRDASKDEIEHGHVHGPDDHHHH